MIIRRKILVSIITILAAFNAALIISMKPHERLIFEFDLPLLTLEHLPGNRGNFPLFDASRNAWIAEGRVIRHLDSYIKDTGPEHGKILIAALPLDGDQETARLAALNLTSKGICHVIFVDSGRTSEARIYPALFIRRVRNREGELVGCEDRFNGFPIA